MINKIEHIEIPRVAIIWNV